MTDSQLKGALALAAAVGLVLTAHQMARAGGPALGIPASAAPLVVAGIAWVAAKQLPSL